MNENCSLKPPAAFVASRQRPPYNLITCRPVGAWRSPVSALVWGTRGRGFKSRRSDQNLQSIQQLFGSAGLAFEPKRTD